MVDLGAWVMQVVLIISTQQVVEGHPITTKQIVSLGIAQPSLRACMEDLNGMSKDGVQVLLGKCEPQRDDAPRKIEGNDV